MKVKFAKQTYWNATTRSGWYFSYDSQTVDLRPPMTGEGVASLIIPIRIWSDMAGWYKEQSDFWRSGDDLRNHYSGKKIKDEAEWQMCLSNCCYVEGKTKGTCDKRIPEKTVLLRYNGPTEQVSFWIIPQRVVSQIVSWYHADQRKIAA